MPINFKTLTDNSGRITGYAAKGSGKLIPPLTLGFDYAGEQLVHKGEEYNIDGHGNLIHPSVEVPEDVWLAWGILLGSGIEFVKDDKGISEVDIDKNVLIPGNTQINAETQINHHAIIRARSIGGVNIIRDHVRIGEGATTGNNVVLHPSVKIGRRAYVGSETELKRNVKVPAEAHIGSNVYLASNVTLVSPESYAPGGVSIVIDNGVRIEQERLKVKEDVHESIPASH